MMEVDLNCRSTGLKSHDKLILLGRELGVNFNHSAALADGFVDVCLSDGDLLLVLLLVLSKLGALQVGPGEVFIRQQIKKKISYLMSIQIWSHFQVFASIKARRALWQEYKANFC